MTVLYMVHVVSVVWIHHRISGMMWMNLTVPSVIWRRRRHHVLRMMMMMDIVVSELDVGTFTHVRHQHIGLWWNHSVRM